MGEARRRGTLEQRAAESVIRRKREQIERDLRRSRAWQQLTPQARAVALLALLPLEGGNG